MFNLRRMLCNVSTELAALMTIVRLIKLWSLTYFYHLRATVVGVSTFLYYKCLNTVHVSAQLAIFRRKISFKTVDILR
jgi:hypothetical protein